jgi:aldose 1-epimerase
MREVITISAGDLRAEIVPTLGGGLARFDLQRGGRREALFRPWPEEGTDDPNQLACYVLVPWSNRISGGGFVFGRRFYSLEPNFPPEPFPLHGNGWISAWSTERVARDSVELSLTSDGPGPFRYRAELAYQLSPTGLSMRLVVTNRSDIALPYGLGFHPWLPRTSDTLLLAAAQDVWLEDGRHLPTQSIKVGQRPEWDFSKLSLLPDAWINNGFAGWNGHARIDWPQRGLALRVEASEQLGNYLLYSPGRDAPFFCFEPVSHLVDAHNASGEAGSATLKVLRPGEIFQVGCRFSVRTLSPP